MGKFTEDRFKGHIQMYKVREVHHINLGYLAFYIFPQVFLHSRSKLQIIPYIIHTQAQLPYAILYQDTEKG